MEWLLHLDRLQNLEQLGQYCLQCHRCHLRSGNSPVIFGEGNPQAKLMLVGEAPGAQEERLQRPFVGPAGVLLDKILEASHIHRQEVYITNVVKCRPSENRTPTEEEADLCFVYLARQIELIRPDLIVCLGALATKYLVQREATIGAVRGDVIIKGGIKIIPTYHPAALLYDENKKKPVWRDFLKIKSLLDGERPEA
ncbi:MAG: uracil-DNA glycosylase [Syntrophaceticus sp.]|nr:uracil-DNA glycosylase [Syntrophaceticus sp.]MDD3314062.1 uracil-DNA glycosylase [Syntrophaceticus sp.]MDD4359571.1 uracil-DNA glycosylase [Syntrophaceticus sp.]MDD4782993.1 uracil-DNA glycosylase [Syntrophaceticus sp.]HBG22393.1 uracil-DNA glycosylase [Peptococcaceae bacterium]